MRSAILFAVALLGAGLAGWPATANTALDARVLPAADRLGPLDGNPPARPAFAGDRLIQGDGLDIVCGATGCDAQRFLQIGPNIGHAQLAFVNRGKDSSDFMVQKHFRTGGCAITHRQTPPNAQIALTYAKILRPVAVN